jgi:hypothetical protein
MAKRAREKARLARQAAKRARRESGGSDDAPPAAAGPDENALMEEFRRLSEKHAAGLVNEDAYLQERHRIFVELGIESEADA